MRFNQNFNADNGFSGIPLGVGPSNNYGGYGMNPGYGAGSQSGMGGGFNPGYGEAGMGIGGALGGMIGGLFNQDPYAAGQQYLGQIPGDIGNSLNPYIQQGRDAMGPYQQHLAQMMNDPSGFVNALGKNYQQSPGYQFQVNQATQAANRAAAAGGGLGSESEQVGLAGTVNNLANQDYQKYLENAMGAYNTGLQGYGGLEQQGFGASEDYAAAMRAYHEQQAQQAEAQVQNQNQQNTAMISGAGSILGSLAGFL